VFQWPNETVVSLAAWMPWSVNHTKLMYTGMNYSFTQFPSPFQPERGSGERTATDTERQTRLVA
jgi:hypothetical protein